MAEKIKKVVIEVHKPECQITGINGNVFNIIGAVSRALKRDGQPSRAKDFEKLALSGNYSYDEILGKLIFEYVDVL